MKQKAISRKSTRYVADPKFLKQYALDHNKTVAGLVREFVQQLRDKEEAEEQ